MYPFCFLSSILYIYIYIYMCVCVCVFINRIRSNLPTFSFDDALVLVDYFQVVRMFSRSLFYRVFSQISSWVIFFIYKLYSLLLFHAVRIIEQVYFSPSVSFCLSVCLSVCLSFSMYTYIYIYILFQKKYSVTLG